MKLEDYNLTMKARRVAYLARELEWETTRLEALLSTHSYLQVSSLHAWLQDLRSGAGHAKSVAYHTEEAIQRAVRH